MFFLNLPEQSGPLLLKPKRAGGTCGKFTEGSVTCWSLLALSVLLASHLMRASVDFVPFFAAAAAAAY